MTWFAAGRLRPRPPARIEITSTVGPSSVGERGQQILALPGVEAAVEEADALAELPLEVRHEPVEAGVLREDERLVAGRHVLEQLEQPVELAGAAVQRLAGREHHLRVVADLLQLAEHREHGATAAEAVVGVARAARDEADFSWRNAAVVEEGGRVAAALVTYPIGDTAEPLDGLGPIVATLQALENRALGSQYVNVLAVYPEFRRRGHARRLLEEAERRAGGRPLSLIVEDSNAAARRLYEDFGFRVAAEVPMVKEDWQSDGTAWVLMLRPAAQASQPASSVLHWEAAGSSLPVRGPNPSGLKYS